MFLGEINKVWFLRSNETDKLCLQQLQENS